MKILWNVIQGQGKNKPYRKDLQSIWLEIFITLLFLPQNLLSYYTDYKKASENSNKGHLLKKALHVTMKRMVV